MAYFRGVFRTNCNGNSASVGYDSDSIAWTKGNDGDLKDVIIKTLKREFGKIVLENRKEAEVGLGTIDWNDCVGTTD